MVLRHVFAALLCLAWMGCSIFEDSSDGKKEAKEPKKSTTTGNGTGIDIDDDGLSCEDSEGLRMIWGFPTDAVRGTIDLALFENENYHFTATWYTGEAEIPPDTAKTAKIVGDKDDDAVFGFDLNDADVPAADGFGGDLKEVTIIIKGKASKLYLCDKDDSNAGGIQETSTSFNSSDRDVGNAKLLKVEMSPLCWGDGVDTAIRTTYKQMFKGCSALKEVGGKIDQGMTDLSDMFKDLTMLEKVDVSAWDTSSVVNMQAMFKGIGSTKKLKVIGFDKLDYSSLQVSGSNPSFSHGMVEMFAGTKLDLPSYKGLLFGLLTKSPSDDPHLGALEQSCGNPDPSTPDANTNCCIKAQYKLKHVKGWEELDAGVKDDLSSGPYADSNNYPNTATYGACPSLLP